MLYRLLQWISGIALHWYYRDVIVLHQDRIPARGPMLVAVNHPNAMVDAMIAQWVVPRRLRITAKATLANTRLGALFVKAVGLIPLRRRSDEPTGSYDPTRNRHAFLTVIHVLGRGEAVLIFPEGKSHNDPSVAPLKSGLANMALGARKAGVSGIHIVPIGLTFEDKKRPGTAVVAHVGNVLALDEWPLDDPRALTDIVAERLRDVALTADISSVSAVSPPLARRSSVSTLAAWWGRIIHKIPIELARRTAILVSRADDDPAMYTMVYGLGFTLIAYILQIVLLWTLFGGVVALGYFLLLLLGAYWAAYASHLPHAEPPSTRR